jgi:hypothetical protein
MRAGRLQHRQAASDFEARLHAAAHVGGNVALDQVRVGGIGRQLVSQGDGQGPDLLSRS